MFWAQILIIEGVDKEYLSRAQKFKTFGNMSQNLCPNILLFFFLNVQFQEIRKKSLFSLKKIEIDFLDLYICG